MSASPRLKELVLAKKARKKKKKKRDRQPERKVEMKTETKAERKAEKKGIEAVGWGFWLICFALLAGPCTYLGYTISHGDRKDTLLPWIIGFSLAAFGAGLLSLAANFIVQKRIEIRRKRAHRGK